MSPFKKEMLALTLMEDLPDKNQSGASWMPFLYNKPEISLNGLKVKNINTIVFGQVNINSLRNKFEQLCECCKDNLDTLLITEIKFDSSFPSEQFKYYW